MWERVGELVDKVNGVIDWFSNIKEHIYDFSIDIFAYCFKLLMMVGLQAPSFIFNNSFTINTTLVFSLISVTLIILLTIFESVIQMTSKVTKQQFTKFEDIMKRLPIAIGVAGCVPFLFEQGFKMINRLTRGIINIGGDLFGANTLSQAISLSAVDVIGMVLFDIVLVGMIIPILLQSGRRYWDLFCLSAISPLALTAFIFDRHRHLFKQWWNTIKKISMIQLVYAVFILLIGIFLYGARFISPDFWIYKILIVLGALFRLSNPPSFVKSYTRGDEEDVIGMFDTYKKTFKGVFNTVTLKNFTPLNYYKSQKALTKQRQALRSQHGKRFVDNLLKK